MPPSKNCFLLLLLLAQTQFAFAVESVPDSAVKNSFAPNAQSVSTNQNLTKDRAKALALAKLVVEANVVLLI